MNATIRISKIDNDLHETRKNIKNLNWKTLDKILEVMTDELNLLYSDLKRKNAYALYEENEMNVINSLIR